MEELKEKIVPNEQLEEYLKHLSNPKHRLQVLIMRDAGLRVSELIKLKWSDFDFRTRTLKVGTLKSRSSDKKTRVVPITQRIFETAAELSEKIKPVQEEYLFPSAKRGGHIHRQSVNQTLTNLAKKHASLDRIAPHDLRHTAITALVANGGTSVEAQNFAGHNNYQTTTIYLHDDKDKIREKLEQSSRKKLTTFQKIKSQFVRKKEKPVLHLATFDNRFLVGRENEIKQINTLLSKDVSVIIVGELGTGKSHILKHLRFPKDKKVFRFDDLKLLKKSILATILELFQGDKEQAKNLIYEGKEDTEISKLISKDSLPSLCRLLCQIVKKNEYILAIDEVDTITPSAVRAIEILKTQFQIITTARSVKLQNASFVSDFEKIDLKNLDRVEGIRLIRKLASGLKIQNFEHFQNHIYNSSEGNPRIIYELVERARKEEFVDEIFVEEISSNYLGRTIKEIDVAFPLLACVAVLFAFWIYSHSESINSMRVLKFGLMVVVMFGRSLLRFFRKNTL